MTAVHSTNCCSSAVNHNLFVVIPFLSPTAASSCGCRLSPLITGISGAHCFHGISLAPVQSKCLLGTNFCATKQKTVPLTRSLCVFFSACWLVGRLVFTCFFVSSWRRRCCENLWPHEDDKHMEKSLCQESPTFFNLIATSQVLSRTKGNGIATLFWSNTFCLVSL